MRFPIAAALLFACLSASAAHKTMRSGNLPKPQLYDLSKDPGKNDNLAARHPDKLKELADSFSAVAGKAAK